MKYKAVLFDMDGTVLDTIGDLTDSMNHSLEHFGYPPITEEQAKAGLGNAARHYCACSVPGDISPERFEEFFEYYRAWYNAHSLIKTAPYEGILQLAADLEKAGCRCAIISNKPDPTVKILSDRFFRGMPAIGESEKVKRKPDPSSVLEMLRELGVDKADAVYIGDTEVDIATAVNAGMDCIAVSWGFRTRQQLVDAGAAVIADTVQQLEALLLA